MYRVRGGRFEWGTPRSVYFHVAWRWWLREALKVAVVVCDSFDGWEAQLSVRAGELAREESQACRSDIWQHLSACLSDTSVVRLGDARSSCLLSLCWAWHRVRPMLPLHVS